MRILFLALPLLAASVSPLLAQRTPATAESAMDSTGTEAAATSIGGYGNAFYQRDFSTQTARMTLERFVLFIGHSFSPSLSLFSELEIEDAKVTGGEPGGEVAIEQAYLKFAFSRNMYAVAGLFIPRIGILNENHLPTTFNGNERTIVETYVIPSTWRELGVGLYGSLDRIPLRYSLALVNGLNASGFEHGSGIREGRFEGRNASANNLAVTGSLQFQSGDVLFQVSGYAGGTAGLPPAEADSLHLASGAFGTPVFLGEADIRYEAHGIQAKILGVVVSIPDAENINRAYASNTPRQMYGAYAEVGYDILSAAGAPSAQQLIGFARVEKLDLSAAVPPNAFADGTLNQTHIVVGIMYLPHPSVVIKADVRLARTGDRNPALPAAAGSFTTNTTFLNLGIGFAF